MPVTTITLNGTTVYDPGTYYAHFAIRNDSGGVVYASTTVPECTPDTEGVASIAIGDGYMASNPDSDNTRLYLSGVGKVTVVAQHDKIFPFKKAQGGGDITIYGNAVAPSTVNGNIKIDGVECKVYDDTDIKEQLADIDSGISPTVVENEDNTDELYRLDITDANGTFTTPNLIGKQGVQGEAGENGADGISCTHSWDGTTLSITSASGTSSADLKGDTGEQGEKGEKGDKGEPATFDDETISTTATWSSAKINESIYNNPYADYEMLGAKAYTAGMSSIFVGYTKPASFVVTPSEYAVVITDKRDIPLYSGNITIGDSSTITIAWDNDNAPSDISLVGSATGQVTAFGMLLKVKECTAVMVAKTTPATEMVVTGNISMLTSADVFECMSVFMKHNVYIKRLS